MRVDPSRVRETRGRRDDGARGDRGRANVAEELLARLWTRFRPERRARGRRPSASRDGV